MQDITHLVVGRSLWHAIFYHRSFRSWQLHVELMIRAVWTSSQAESCLKRQCREITSKTARNIPLSDQVNALLRVQNPIVSSSSHFQKTIFALLLCSFSLISFSTSNIPRTLASEKTSVFRLRKFSQIQALNTSIMDRNSKKCKQNPRCILKYVWMSSLLHAIIRCDGCIMTDPTEIGLLSGLRGSAMSIMVTCDEFPVYSLTLLVLSILIVPLLYIRWNCPIALSSLESNLFERHNQRAKSEIQRMFCLNIVNLKQLLDLERKGHNCSSNILRTQV